MTVSNIVLGSDNLGLELQGLEDREVLNTLKGEFPGGFKAIGCNAGAVWIQPRFLLELATEDESKINFTGLAHIGAELTRLACDPEQADELGGMAVDRLITRFARMAWEMSQAKGPNQLHAVKFGVGAKVVASFSVEPGTIEISPTGSVAREMALKAFGPSGMIADLEGLHVVLERHPFLLPYVARIVFNPLLTRSLIMANRADHRTTNKGDVDGK